MYIFDNILSLFLSMHLCIELAMAFAHWAPFRMDYFLLLGAIFDITLKFFGFLQCIMFIFWGSEVNKVVYVDVIIVVVIGKTFHN